MIDGKVKLLERDGFVYDVEFTMKSGEIFTVDEILDSLNTVITESEALHTENDAMRKRIDGLLSIISGLEYKICEKDSAFTEQLARQKIQNDA